MIENHASQVEEFLDATHGTVPAPFMPVVEITELRELLSDDVKIFQIGRMHISAGACDSGTKSL